MKKSHIILLIVVLVPISAGIALHMMVQKVKARTAAAWSDVEFAEFAIMTDPGHLDHGAALYGQFCARCHFSVNDGGAIGPAIDGQKWKDADDFAGLCQVIAEGRPGTAMIPWKTALSPKEVRAVASYLWPRPDSPPPPAPAPGTE